MQSLLTCAIWEQPAVGDMEAQHCWEAHHPSLRGGNAPCKSEMRPLPSPLREKCLNKLLISPADV